MIRIRLVLLTLLLGTLATSVPAVRAQSYVYQFGNNPWSVPVSVPGGYVDAANGNLHIEIPIAAMPERGSVPFVAKLVYDSHIWIPGTSSWLPINVPNSWSGWRLVTTAGAGGGVTYKALNKVCYQNLGHGQQIPWNYTVYTNFGFTTPDGHYVPFSGATTDNYDDAPCISGHDTLSEISTDASGYHLDVTNDYVAVVHAPDGTQVFPRVEDTNGNYFSVPNSSGDVTDSVGRTPITTTVNGNTITYKVTNSQNLTYTVTVTTETIPVSTAFGQSGLTEYASTPPSTNYLTVVQSIALPTGTYGFTYDSGTISGHYGTLTGMTLPTGGTATFGFGVFADAYANKNQWLSNSTASGVGTTTYTPTVTSACTNAYCAQSFVVNQPDGSSQGYGFTFDNGSLINGSPWNVSQGFYDTTANGNALLASSTTDYDFSNAPTVTPIRHTTTLPIPGGSISKKSEYTYDTTLLGNVLTQNDWNFYSGTPPSTQYRATKYTYLANSDNDMVNKKASINIYPGASTTAASSTTINYDGTTTSSMTSVTQHDDTNFPTTYNARGNVTSVVANSLTTTMTYDMTGQATSVKDSNNNATTLSYADNYFDDSASGPMTHSGSTDTNAYLTKTTNALGWITNLGYYWGSGKLAKTVDYNTATTTFDYMDADRPTQTKAAMGWGITNYTSATQTDSYLGIADTTPSTSCSSCRHDVIGFDNLGRVITQSLPNDPDGADTATTTYDSVIGRTLSVSNPKRTVSGPTDGSDTYTHDGLGRILTVTHSAGGVVHTYYGAKVTSAVGGNQTQLCSATTYGYGYPTLAVDEAGMKREVWSDGFGRTIEVDEPDSAGNLTVGTCYTYDVLNNLLTVVQGSQSRSYTYDAASRLLTATTPESGTVTSYYTTSGGAKCSGNPSAVCRRTDARAITTTYSYDSLNRLSGITYTGGTAAVTYTYDSGTNQKGFRTGMTDGSSGTTTWTYNLAGWVLTENRTIAGRAKTISYTYNQDGSLATMVYPSGRTITYTTNDAQRTTSAKDIANNIQYAVTASYAPIGALTGVIYGPATGFGGITTAAVYNSRFEPTTVLATSTGGTAQNLAYSFSLPGGNNGSVSSIQNNANSGLSETFSYDYLNRILSAATTATSGSGCWGQSFGPSGTPPPGPADDAYSNLTQINATNCTVGALGIAVSATTNRVTTTGYAFDAAGNMTQEPSPNGYGYTYDAENHLTQVTGTGSGTWTYVYDGNGMRVEKSNASGGTLYFRSLSGATIAETDLSGNITSEYIFFAGQRIARRDANNNVYYYYTDQVGSTTTITTGTGSPCYDATFTPYGEEHNTLNTCPQNYKFTGYERDPETGLDYAFARFYNSRLGRFMSADPLNGDTGDPQSLNRYAYVLNNSTNLNDPLGFKCYVGEGCHDLGFGAWGGWGWGFGIAVANGNLGPGFPATDDWTYTFVDTWTRPDGTIGQYSETSGGTVDAPTFPFFPSDDLAGAGGGSTLQNIRNIINRALKQSRLSQCLHQFFGSGSILTNQNLPYIDATQTSIQLGAMGTVADPVPPSGRSTVEIASDVVNNSFAPELGQRVYLHEVANALAYQDFTNSPYGVRPFLGPFGGPPTSSQRAQNQPGGDPDIGREFEKCVFGNSLSGNGKN